MKDAIADTSSSGSPLLLTLLQKVMAKGHTIEVVETHHVWSGKILAAVPNQSAPDAIDITVLSTDALRYDIKHQHRFTIRQPERWKLGKDAGGNWCLWPPRSKSRNDERHGRLKNAAR